MDRLDTWIKEVEGFIDKNEDINTHSYLDFIENPDLSLLVIDKINAVDEELSIENPRTYTACIFILDVCVSQLQTALEHGNKHADRLLNKLMLYLADKINNSNHSLSFWLPALNAFYDVNVALIDELKSSYYALASSEDEIEPVEQESHLNSIRELILDLSDLTVFDIAENFFAQSSVMPPAFFVDLILDLYSIEEGHDIALLALLHPNIEVREVVIETISSIINSITLSSISLSRLQMIRHWYPSEYHAQIDNWIRIQRKQGVVFSRSQEYAEVVDMKASEIDGAGGQGIFLHVRKDRKNRLMGLLLKQSVGIKDAWVTPDLSAQEIVKYNKEAFDDTLVLRKVDLEYLQLLVNHFLAITISKGNMPDLHLLEIQEELGLQFIPEMIDINDLMQKLSIQINPFTEDVVENSLNRSKKWLKNKRFADSWFIESPDIDRLVNSCSSYVDGIKICATNAAMDKVFQEHMEKNRDFWILHFLWLALWAKVHSRANEKIWEDSFIIAYSIYSEKELNLIPIMREICRKSVLNSMQTMRERGTYLSG